jgi:hypothetical protein
MKFLLPYVRLALLIRIQRPAKGVHPTTRSTKEVYNLFHSWGMFADCTSTETRFEVENVGTHEVGHVIALGHVKDPEAMATMYPSASRGEVKKKTRTTTDIAGRPSSLLNVRTFSDHHGPRASSPLGARGVFGWRYVIEGPPGGLPVGRDRSEPSQRPPTLADVCRHGAPNVGMEKA